MFRQAFRSAVSIRCSRENLAMLIVYLLPALDIITDSNAVPRLASTSSHCRTSIPGRRPQRRTLTFARRSREARTCCEGVPARTVHEGYSGHAAVRVQSRRLPDPRDPWRAPGEDEDV